MSISVSHGVPRAHLDRKTGRRVFCAKVGCTQQLGRVVLVDPFGIEPDDPGVYLEEGTRGNGRVRMLELPEGFFEDRDTPMDLVFRPSKRVHENRRREREGLRPRGSTPYRRPASGDRLDRRLRVPAPDGEPLVTVPEVRYFPATIECPRCGTEQDLDADELRLTTPWDSLWG